MSGRVLMIGPDPGAKGGIASVITMYGQAGLFERHAFLATTTEGTRSQKIRHFLTFLRQYRQHLAHDPAIRIVHIHLAVRGSVLRKHIAMTLARRAGKRVILHFHGAQFERLYKASPPWMRMLIRDMFAHADLVLCLNRGCQQHIRALTGAEARVLPNPVCMRQPVRQDAQGPVRFLFMGRLGERKGVYDLIEAARLLPEGIAELHLYGDGELDRVRRRIQEAGVADRVHAHGWISGAAKEAVFGQAHGLVLPSYNEGLPIAILEAMAHGMPVVATPVGGIPEAVEDRRSGFLVAPGNVQALAAALIRLAQDRPLREAMGRIAYQRAQETYDLPRVVATLEGLYAEWLEEAPPSALMNRLGGVRPVQSG